jgi:hypothetical protein
MTRKTIYKSVKATDERSVARRRSSNFLNKMFCALRRVEGVGAESKDYFGQKAEADNVEPK